VFQIATLAAILLEVYTFSETVRKLRSRPREDFNHSIQCFLFVFSVRI